MVLVVESDAGLRRAMHLLLIARGYGVKAYADEGFLIGDPATRDGACLIAEYRPPYADGIGLLRQLRAARWHHPAILTTDDRSAETESRAHGAGYAHVLRKPFAHHVLLDLVDGVLSRGPRQARE
ncbi:response regulator [Sphingomonas histidinilytica]|nr:MULTISPECIES: response regulator [Sphingomonadaceae]AMK22899.1 response regulator receiver protein [Sphingobium sp. TKS]MBO9380698.1 response regulator [Rhizorhabdus histidinilytica]